MGTPKPPDSSRQNFREVTVPGVHNVNAFIRLLGSATVIAAISVNANVDEPLVHIVFDDSEINLTEIASYGAHAVDEPYVKPGYTPIAFTASGRGTFKLVATQRSALENPNFPGFVQMLLGATYGADQTVFGDRKGNTVNVFVATDVDRVLYGVTDNRLHQIQGLPKGRVQFAIDGEVVAFARHRTRDMNGTTMTELAEHVRRGRAPGWRTAGRLQNDLLLFGRASQRGGLLLTVVGKNSRPETFGGRFKLSGERGTIEFQPQTDLVRGDGSLIIGPTSIGENGQTQIAALNVDDDTRPRLGFRNLHDLPAPMQALIGRMETGDPPAARTR